MKINDFERIDSGQYRIDTDVGTVELVRVYANLWQMVGPHHAEKFRTMNDAVVGFPEFVRAMRRSIVGDETRAKWIDSLDRPDVAEALKAKPHPIRRFAVQGQTLWDYVEWIRSTLPGKTDVIVEAAGPTIAKVLSGEVVA